MTIMTPLNSPISNIASIFTLSACWLTVASTGPVKHHESETESAQVSAFESKLDKRVEHFDTAGRTLIASVLDLAYEYELPIGIEYVDRALTRPIKLEFHHDSVRGILVAI